MRRYCDAVSVNEDHKRAEILRAGDGARQGPVERRGTLCRHLPNLMEGTQGGILRERRKQILVCASGLEGWIVMDSFQAAMASSNSSVWNGH
jgi:hypothetical protein